VNDLRAREKRKLFATLLETGITALHLDPRRPGVIVPGRFADQSWLVLNYSYRYGIADFRFDDQVVEASLSFAGQPFYCRVPWQAVFAMTDSTRQRGRIWHDEVPADVDDAVQGGRATPPESHGTAPRDPPRDGAPSLRAVQGQGEGSAERAARPRPGLQLIAGGKQPALRAVPAPDEGSEGGAETEAQDDPEPPRPVFGRARLRRIK